MKSLSPQYIGDQVRQAVACGMNIGKLMEQPDSPEKQGDIAVFEKSIEDIIEVLTTPPGQGVLVWERVCDHVIEHTDFQFSHEARVNGKGPVVGVVMRKQMQHYALGSSGKIFEAYLYGEKIAEDYMRYWHDPASLRDMERIVEHHYAACSR